MGEEPACVTALESPPGNQEVSKEYFLAVQVLPWSKRDQEGPCEDFWIVPTIQIVPHALAQVAQLSAKALGSLKQSQENSEQALGLWNE